MISSTTFTLCLIQKDNKTSVMGMNKNANLILGAAKLLAYVIDISESMLVKNLQQWHNSGERQLGTVLLLRMK